MIALASIICIALYVYTFARIEVKMPSIHDAPEPPKKRKTRKKN